MLVWTKEDCLGCSMLTSDNVQEYLEVEQAKNLAYAEKMAAEFPLVCGVPIVAGLNYELVQIFNAITIEEAGLFRSSASETEEKSE